MSPPKPSSPTPTPSVPPTPKHRAMSVGPVQLVSRTFGVAAVRRCRAPDGACHDHLVATEDFGRTWIDLTPPDIPTNMPIISVFFLDPEHGWFVASDCASSSAFVYRTQDGGRRWRRTPTDPADCHAGSTAHVDFVDPNHGWLIRRSFVGEYTMLRRTVDGGRTWTRSRNVPPFGDAVFTDPTAGWLTSMTNGRPLLMRSGDAGRTWSRVALPNPSCCRGWRAALGLPVFSDADHGVLEETWQHAHRTVLVFDSTVDGGRSWRVSDVRPIPGTNHGQQAVSATITGPRTWWTVAGTPNRVSVTSDGGKRWRRAVTPDTRNRLAVEAIDARHAWGIGRVDGASPLLVTRDGGLTWHAAAPRRSRRPNFADLRTVLPLTGVVTALTVAPDDALIGQVVQHWIVPRQVIVRFEPRTGRYVTSAPIRSALGGVDRIAVAGDSVWEAPGNPRNPGSTSALIHLDAATLAREERIPMPAPPVALAATPAGLWVATGRQLVLLDPWTEAVQRTLMFRGHVGHIESSPDGSRIYVTTDGPVRRSTFPLLELDASTGELLARSWQGSADDLNGISSLSASGAGVWVTAPTGMMSYLTLLSESGLTLIAVGPEGTNGRSAYIAGPILWSADISGYLCADPETGATRGYVGILDSPVGTSDVVSTSVGFFVGTESGIARIVPPPACLAR